MATNLRVYINIVTPASRVFNYYDVRMFSYISHPLSWSPRHTDGRDNTLQKFEFRDIPIVNHCLLPFSPPSVDDRCLIVMESLKGCEECSTVAVEYNQSVGTYLVAYISP